MSFAGLRGSFWKKKGGGAWSPPAGMTWFMSFRQLSGYTGYCCRIERVSDSTFIDVGFVGGYVDLSAISTFCAGTTGRLRAWYNQASDYSNYFGGGGPSSGIVYQSGSLNLVGGQLAVYYSSGAYSSIFGSLPLAPSSLFVTSKVRTISTINYVLYGGNGYALSGTFSGVNGATIFSGSTNLGGNSSEIVGSKRLDSFINVSGEYNLWTNGADNASFGTSLANPSFSTIGRSGTSLGLNGDLFEIVSYSDDKSPSRTTIESEINSYYSIY